MAKSKAPGTRVSYRLRKSTYGTGCWTSQFQMPPHFLNSYRLMSENELAGIASISIGMSLF
ncbi:MAG TPA: hypothetical protein VIH89_17770 [Candidatus Sulfotelmatobacter sp.]